MHGASDKWKEDIKNISETKHEQEDCPTQVKIARLINISDYTGGGSCPPPRPVRLCQGGMTSNRG